MKHETCLEGHSEVSAQSHASCARPLTVRVRISMELCMQNNCYGEVLTRSEKDKNNGKIISCDDHNSLHMHS
jgi:hypothetical protein